MSSKILQLAFGSRDLFQAEKKITVVTSCANSQNALKMVLGEKIVLLSENSCHFVSCSVVTRVKIFSA